MGSRNYQAGSPFMTFVLVKLGLYYRYCIVERGISVGCLAKWYALPSDISYIKFTLFFNVIESGLLLA